MQSNSLSWEREYRDPQFLTLGTEPISDVRNFMRWMKKQVRKNPQDFSAPIDAWTVFDAGCGNGKNLKYITENFCNLGIGYDISKTAIDIARNLSENLPIRYEVRSIGEVFPLADKSVDLTIDMTSSNSLNESERAIFLNEVSRVLKPGGYFVVRTLCLDGDANAKKLLRLSPGREKDTYTLPDVGVTERVFSKSDFTQIYTKNFELVHLEKTNGYQKWNNQSYKRNYWIAYLKKVI